MTKTVFLTGASGFVGSGVLRYLLDNTDWYFITPYTARHHGEQGRVNRAVTWYDRLSRVYRVPMDLSQPFKHSDLGNVRKPDYILNIASESHVDRSLEDPVPFIQNNVALMTNVLEYAREVKPDLLLHMSTDEVYGNADPHESHEEWSAIRPSNPYSASKAAQEAIAYSYWRSFGVPLIITNTMNLIAPADFTNQSPEKFVPMVLRRLSLGEAVDIHVDEDGNSGSRCWIDVRDFADAWLFLIDKYEGGLLGTLTYYPEKHHYPHRFNIVGPEASNRYVAERLAHWGGYRNAVLKNADFHSQRPGHDARYSLDGSLMTSLGWTPKRTLDGTLFDIVNSYGERPDLLES